MTSTNGDGRKTLASLMDIAAGFLPAGWAAIDASIPVSEIEGWDSLTHVTICVAVEERLGVRLGGKMIRDLMERPLVEWAGMLSKEA